MGKFLVTVYDRQVRHYEKVFEASDDVEARRLAEEESVTDEGWRELYDELFSEQTIEDVRDVTDEDDVEEGR